MGNLIMPDYEIVRGDAKAVVSSTGGTIKNFVVGGKDIFYPWHKVGEDKERGGFPLCSPWFGLSPRGTKKHGFLRELKASEVIRGGLNSISMTFNQGPTENYPWSLEHLTFASLLEDRILFLTLCIKRLEDSIKEPAPVFPGFHPYFLRCSGGNQASSPMVSVGDGTVFDSFLEESKTVSLAKSTRHLLVFSAAGLIEMELCGKAWDLVTPHMVLWSDSEEYFCAEPIFGDRKLFDNPGGIYLEPNEWLSLGIALKVHN